MSLQVPVSRRRRGWDLESPERIEPFRRMSQQMERMFEDLVGTTAGFPRMFRGEEMGLGGMGGLAGLRGLTGIAAGRPNVDVSETKDSLEVEVDLPGMDERDIDITLSDDILTIKGERKEEREDRGRNYYRAERDYGAFARRIVLPFPVHEDRIVANFDKGVLRVTLPKSAEAKARERHIEIRPR